MLDRGLEARSGQTKDYKIQNLYLKIAPSGGGAKFVGVFRVKNHDFTQNNHIFSNFGSPLLTLVVI